MSESLFKSICRLFLITVKTERLRATSSERRVKEIFILSCTVYGFTYSYLKHLLCVIRETIGRNVCTILVYFCVLIIAEAYLKPSQTSKMELFAKIDYIEWILNEPQ